jgi:hypothetical protein
MSVFPGFGLCETNVKKLFGEQPKTWGIWLFNRFVKLDEQTTG